MAKKTFLPARLSVKKDRWEIVFYQTDPAGQYRRFRETRDINRIADITERRKHAKRHISEINKALPMGYPFEAEVSATRLTVVDAINKVYAEKSRAAPAETLSTWRSVRNVFFEFLKLRGLERLPVRDFCKANQRDFVHYLLNERLHRGKNLSPISVNNNVGQMGTYFSCLLEDELIDKNPFAGWKRLKPDPKKRRNYTDSEREIIFRAAFERNRRLFYALVIQFYTFLRGTEIGRLQFHQFNFQTGVIDLPAKKAKDKDHRTPTIPLDLLHLFAAPEFSSCPVNYFVFGEDLHPSPVQSLKRDKLNDDFQILLGQLVAEKLLDDADGLSFYSTKDSGITEMLGKMDLMDVVNQAGHSDPRTTMLYYHRPKRSEAIRAMKVKLF